MISYEGISDRLSRGLWKRPEGYWKAMNKVMKIIFSRDERKSLKKKTLQSGRKDVQYIV